MRIDDPNIGDSALCWLRRIFIPSLEAALIWLLCRCLRVHPQLLLLTVPVSLDSVGVVFLRLSLGDNLLTAGIENPV